MLRHLMLQQKNTITTNCCSTIATTTTATKDCYNCYNTAASTSSSTNSRIAGTGTLAVALVVTL